MIVVWSKLCNLRFSISKNQTLLFLVAFALIIRLAFFMFLSPWTWSEPFFNEHMFTDDKGYHNIAKDIVETTPILGTGNVQFARSWLSRGHTRRTPLYPLYVAFFYRLFGIHFWPVILSQVLLDSLLVVAIYSLSKMVLDSDYAPAVASVIYAANPLAVYHSTLIRTEMLFTLLFTLSVYLLVRAFVRGLKTKEVALTGFVMALSCLVRPIVYYYPLTLTVLFLLDKGFRSRNLKGKSVCILSFLLCFYLTVGVWQARNLVYYDYYSLSTIQGSNLCRYNAKMLMRHVSRLYRIKQIQNFCYAHDIPGAFQQSAARQQIAIQFISQYPREYLSLHLNGIKHMFQTTIMKSWGGKSSRLVANYGVIFESYGLSPLQVTSTLRPIFKTRLQVENILLLIGTIYLLIKKQSRFYSLLLATAILYQVIVIGIVGGAEGGRFRLPISPLISVFSAYGLYWITSIIAWLASLRGKWGFGR